MATLQTLSLSGASSNIFENVENERQRIARDLHDSIGGMLATALLLFDGVEAQNQERFQKVKELLKETQREVRRIAHNMTPVVLNKLGLVAALEQTCEELNATGTIVVDFYNSDKSFFKKLDKSLQINVFRMVQELLQNTLKHAEASHIDLFLQHSATHIILLYEDNGKGIGEGKQQHKAMRSLRERIKMTNGKIRIKSIATCGTFVRIEVPIT